MKKLIFILMTAAAFSCGDGSNRSSQGNDNANDGMENSESAEPADTTGTTGTGTTGTGAMQSDTTASPSGGAGTRSDTTRSNQ